VNRPTDGAQRLASIPGQRLGRERLQPLSPGERQFYRWILRAFAADTPPAADTLADAASAFDLEVDVALAAFAREDLIHHDPRTRAITVAYPFSGQPRGHRVLIDDSRTVEAMCALDALGIAAMLNLPIEVSSRDPRTDDEVWVRVHPGEGAWWEPQSAVVLIGKGRNQGPSFRSCCDVLNFFESADSAAAYLGEHPELTGESVPIPQAIEDGQAIFGDILAEADV
jgi:hypothetical protein